MHRLHLVVFAGIVSLASPAWSEDTGAKDSSESPTERLYPHPVITEVLFNVPKGDDADANADGTRQSTADEFVELFNPHSRTINLRAYSITNRLTTYDAKTKRGVRFIFPSFEMKPGDVVIVFNGHDARIPGPVGTQERPPKEPNDRFDGAHVFSMTPSARTNAFANTADFALLSDPQGHPIDAVSWNDPDPSPPRSARRTQVVNKNPKGSVQRADADADLRPHRDIDLGVCSPGSLPNAQPATAEVDDPEDSED